MTLSDLMAALRTKAAVRCGRASVYKILSQTSHHHAAYGRCATTLPVHAWTASFGATEVKLGMKKNISHIRKTVHMFQFARENGIASDSSSSQYQTQRHASKSSSVSSKFQDDGAPEIGGSRMMQQETGGVEIRRQRWGQLTGLTVDTALAQSAAIAAREKRVSDEG